MVCRSWIPPVILDVDETQEFDVVTSLLLKMLSDGAVNVSIAGNFSFVTGGLLFEPKGYVQVGNVPCCIQEPKEERKLCVKKK